MENVSEDNMKLPFAWIFILVPFAIVFTCLVFFLFGLLARGNPISIIKSLGFDDIRTFAVLVSTLGTGVAVLVLYLLLRRVGMGMKDVGFRGKLSLKGAIYAFIAFIGAWIIYGPIEFALGKLGVSMYWNSVREIPLSLESRIDIIVAVVGSVILAPLTEDTIFRGYVLSMFRQRCKTTTAVALSVLIFAILHLPFLGVGLAIYLVPWTIISCYLFLKFDNLYSAMLFHGVNNLSVYVIYPLIMAR